MQKKKTMEHEGRLSRHKKQLQQEQKDGV